MSALALLRADVEALVADLDAGEAVRDRLVRSVQRPLALAADAALVTAPPPTEKDVAPARPR